MPSDVFGPAIDDAAPSLQCVDGRGEPLPVIGAHAGRLLLVFYRGEW